MQYGVRQLGAERGPVSAAPQPTLGLASAAGTSGGRGDTASSSRTPAVRAQDHTHLPLVLTAWAALSHSECLSFNSRKAWN